MHCLEEQAKEDLATAHRHLLQQAERVEQIASRLARTLRERGTDALVDSHGELQTVGVELDRLCGVYSAKLDALVAMRNAFRAAATDLAS
jgi:hypothetical protein